MNRVAAVIKKKAAEHLMELPFIIIEPGRSIAGAAGITLYTVGAVKEIENVRTYVSIDGGMTDNPRYILYQSTYEILCANKANEPKTEKITLDFVTTEDIKSTLKGDLNVSKQTLNLVYATTSPSTIVIPSFDKSKMTFSGNIGITGSFVNPLLNGNILVPSLDIPEIPVTMTELDIKLNGHILNGNGLLKKFKSGGIEAENITSDFSLKGNDFCLNNLKGTAFDGKIGGNIIDNQGIFYGLLLTAMISMNLAIFNFLPIPALDGGHALFLILEKINGKPVDEKVMERISSTFFMMLILLMI